MGAPTERDEEIACDRNFLTVLGYNIVKLGARNGFESK
jgi:hypothetical protein